MLRLFLTFITIAACSATCGIVPQFWCDSKEIASKCDVEAQCAEYRWVDPAAKPVMFEMYTESHCGACIRFLFEQLYPTWQALQNTGILNLTLYVYGNAKQVYNPDTKLWNFTCQHGFEECQMNLFENCVQHYTNNDANKYMPILNCIEQTLSDPTKDEMQCIFDAGMDFPTINKCATGPEGNALMHKAGAHTESLNPHIEGTPTIYINGLHSNPMQYEIQVGNLTQFICDTYQGVKPPECRPSRQ